MDKKPARRVPARPVTPKARNRFGDPVDTVYAGGTPLFDERTGKSITQKEYERRRKSPPKR